MELVFSDEAKAQIEGYVQKIHESPRYFNEMVKRAHIYMPFIEEAFANVRVPQDLKYLAIQESSLRSDVVSSADAVGFWQFKEGAAKDFGLRINDRVDERRHIYRASEAAAQYLATANGDFDNWVYAVLAYYHGLTGAVTHTNPEFYGKDTMKITTDLHWYVLKAIAHKIAYEKALRTSHRPSVSLYPFSTHGEINIQSILERHEMSEEEFFVYNKWILDGKKLPKNELFTYYVPQSSTYYAGHMPDPNKVRGGGAPVFLTSNHTLASNSDNLSLSGLVYGPENMEKSVPKQDEAQVETPKEIIEPQPEPKTDVAAPVQPVFPKSAVAIAVDDVPSPLYVDFELKQDLHYGVQYIVYDGKKSLAEIAYQHDVKLPNLLVWNGMLPGNQPMPGTMIYLNKPSKTEYHVIRSGESLASIAARHYTTEPKLIRLNRLNPANPIIYEGQKLYLKKKKPVNEKYILLKENVLDIIENATMFAGGETIEQKEEKVVAETQENPPMKTRMVEMANQGATTSEAPAQPAKEEESEAINEDESAIQEVRTRWVSHTVVAGESLWEISQKYGTKVEIIKMINKLSTDTIPEGMTLKILAKEDLVGK